MINYTKLVHVVRYKNRRIVRNYVLFARAAIRIYRPVLRSRSQGKKARQAPAPISESPRRTAVRELRRPRYGMPNSGEEEEDGAADGRTGGGGGGRSCRRAGMENGELQSRAEQSRATRAKPQPPDQISPHDGNTALVGPLYLICYVWVRSYALELRCLECYLKQMTRCHRPVNWMCSICSFARQTLLLQRSRVLL